VERFEIVYVERFRLDWISQSIGCVSAAQVKDRLLVLGVTGGPMLVTAALTALITD
jgi:hypothetical protein